MIIDPQIGNNTHLEARTRMADIGKQAGAGRPLKSKVHGVQSNRKSKVQHFVIIARIIHDFFDLSLTLYNSRKKQYGSQYLLQSEKIKIIREKRQSGSDSILAFKVLFKRTHIYLFNI